MAATRPTPKTRTTTDAKRQEVPLEAPPIISREDYATFIGQIELVEIWLHEANVVNKHGPQTPEQATFRFSSKATWESQPAGFRIFHHYSVCVEAADALFAEVNVTFGLDFASKEPMTEAVFAIFEDVNLSVNTWPFLREFVSTTMGRMNWIPFTLPALKKGVRRASRSTGEKTTRTARSRRKPQVPE